MSDIPQIQNIVAELRLGKTPPPVPIRTFLGWFNAQRRTPRNIENINAELQKADIKTVPHYLGIWVDTPITFEFATNRTKSDSGEHDISTVDGGTESEEPGFDTDHNAGDPSYTIGEIASANNAPIRVAPTASLLEATTLMISRNFSQLPVMPNDRDVKGVISWESIGARHATNIASDDVQSYMDSHYELPIGASLFSAINMIVEHNYVLIRAPDRRITGIVTSTDIAQQFELISTPFLLLAEIEKNLRILISSKLRVSDIKKACSKEHLPPEFKSIADLTFGNYVRVLSHPENWGKLKLRLDRAAFCSELSEINIIRNDVMHFDPDPLTQQDLAKLRNSAKMLNMLRSIGAF